MIYLIVSNALFIYIANIHRYKQDVSLEEKHINLSERTLYIKYICISEYQTQMKFRLHIYHQW